MIKREINITGLAHDLAEGSVGVAIVSTTVYWGLPHIVSALCGSPLPPIIKFIYHRVKAQEQPLKHHIKDFIWETLVWGAGWWVVIFRNPIFTLLAFIGWWLILTYFRRVTKWGSP